MMNTSSPVEFFAGSELEKFILNHELLGPGDKLDGKIIEIKKDGKALIDFGAFRALAEIKFPIKTGETLRVIVDAKEPQLKLRLDNSRWVDVNI
jgi:ribosomal protein S1